VIGRHEHIRVAVPSQPATNVRAEPDNLSRPDKADQAGHSGFGILGLTNRGGSGRAAVWNFLLRRTDIVIAVVASTGNAEGGAIFGAGTTPVVGPGGRHVGVAEPFLDFAQVGAPVQGVGDRRGPRGMGSKAFSINPGSVRVFAQPRCKSPRG
jgi:hypothetical protein